MKRIKKTLIAATLIAGTVVMSSAFSITLRDVPGLNTNELSVRIDDGVATLFGNADSGIERHLAQRYLENLEEVDRVINLASHK